MKVLALLLVAGCVATSQGAGFFGSGKEYRFAYEGRIISGLPELNSQFSGVGIRAEVVVVAKSSDQLALQVINPKYVQVNDVLSASGSSEESRNWRNLKLPSFTDVPAEHKQILASPVEFSTSSEVTMAQDEPVWSINFKKALVVLFRSKMAAGLFSIEEGLVYRVTEHALDGECESTYQVNKVSRSAMERYGSDVFPSPSACSGGDYYEVVRTRDLNTCTKRNTFKFYKPGQYSCPEGNGVTTASCGSMWSRSSITRYYGCGSRDDFTIQSIVNEGEFNQDIVGFKAERMVTGTQQVVKLKSVRAAGDYPTPNNPTTHSNVMYEFFKKNSDLGMGGLQDPRSSFAAAGIDHVDVRDISQQIKQLLTQAAQILKNGDDLSKNQVNQPLLSAARGLSMLAKDDLKSIYNSLGESRMMQNLFADVVIMSGSRDSVKLAIELIQEGKMSDSKTTHFFAWLPHYLVTPTEEILNALFELATSSAIKSKPYVYNAAIPGISKLVQLACLKDDRNSAYPTDIFGEFCSPDSDIVSGKLVPFLTEQLKSASASKKSLYITALGFIQTEDSMQALSSVIDRSIGQVSDLNRVLAVFNFAEIAFTKSRAAAPILLSVLGNPSEKTELRVFAFNALIQMNPSVSVFNQIVAITRQEPHMDPELLKAINTGLFTLGELEVNEQMCDPLKETIGHAKSAYYFIRKTDHTMFHVLKESTNTIFTAQMLEKLGLGINTFSTWVKSEGFALPKAAYYQLKYIMDRFSFNVVEAGVVSNNMNQVFDKLYKLVTGSEETDGDWSETINFMTNQARESGMPEAVFWVKIFENGPLFYSFNEESVRTELLPYLTNLILQDVSSDNLSYQVAYDIAPVHDIIPSEMGLPIQLIVHTLITYSITGNARLDFASFAVKADARIIRAVNSISYVGTVNPFTQSAAVTGTNIHTGLNLPAKANCKLHYDSRKLTVDLVPPTSGKTNFFHQHVIPFTAVFKMNDFSPLDKTQYKLIKSGEAEVTNNYSYPDYFGIAFKGNFISESAHAKTTCPVYDYLHMYKKMSNLFSLIWTVPSLKADRSPSIRKHEYNFIVDHSASEAKEVKMSFQCAPGGGSDGFGFKFDTAFVRKSGDPSTISWDMKCSKSVPQFKEHWDVKLQDSRKQKFCLKGSLQSGGTFDLRNVMGLGSSCSDSKVITTATSKDDSKGGRSIKFQNQLVGVSDYIANIDQYAVAYLRGVWMRYIGSQYGNKFEEVEQNVSSWGKGNSYSNEYDVKVQPDSQSFDLKISHPKYRKPIYFYGVPTQCPIFSYVPLVKSYIASAFDQSNAVESESFDNKYTQGTTQNTFDKEGKCYMMKHAVKELYGEFCISQVPISQCSLGCSYPKFGAQKNVPFTCIPEDKASKIKWKVMQGRLVKDVFKMKTDFHDTVAEMTRCN